MAQFLTRAAILAVPDVAEREIISVPEWGGKVLARGLSASERDEFEASLVDGDGKPALENMRAKLVAMGAIDEAGNRLFSLEDVAALGAKHGRPIVRIAAAVQRLSKMSEKDLEELSAAVQTPGDAKSGDLPSPSGEPGESSSPASAPESSTSSGPSTNSIPSANDAPTGGRP